MKNFVCFLVAAVLLARTLPAYDMGSGQTFQNGGCGYEESCWTPGWCLWGLGILVTAAMVTGIIVLANSGTPGFTHSHLTDNNTSSL